MRLSRTIACALAAGSMMLTSCLSTSNDDQITTETFNNCFSYRVNKATGGITMDKNNSLTIKTNYTQVSISATIGSLTVGDITLPSPTFEDMKLQQNNTGWMIAEATSVRPQVKGFSDETVPMFNRVRFGSINHLAELNGEYRPGYERILRLETDNEIAFVSPKSAFSAGETKVLNKTDASEPLFKSPKPIYVINLDTEKNTASITIYNAIFAPAMEKLGLVIQFKDLPFTVDASGRLYIRHSDTFNPYHDNAPNAAYPISNLNLVWDFFSGIEISFDCDAHGKSYRVSADMPFNYGYDSSKN